MTTGAKKISELPSLVVPSGDDVVVIVDSPANSAITKKITVSNLLSNVVSNTVYVGSNVVLTTSTIRVGNSTVNVSANSTGFFINGSATVSTSGNVSFGGILSAPQLTRAANAAGSIGQVCWDSNYIYVCTAINTWKRAALTGGY